MFTRRIARGIFIEAAASALDGQMPEVAVDGWNVTTAERSFPDNGGAAVAPNKEAFVGPKQVVAASAPDGASGN
ncbi:MAG: hypothetical protein ACLP9L_31885 [Thermoguttaceae bacterium]